MSVCVSECCVEAESVCFSIEDYCVKDRDSSA